MADRKKMRASPATKDRKTTRPGTGSASKSGGRPAARPSGRALDARGDQAKDRRQQQPPGALPKEKKDEEEDKNAVQASDKQRATPPFPSQKQPRPGLEAEMEPRPEYDAPTYRAAGKLEGKVALITGGDSGIGRAVAVLYAREGADVAIVYLPEEQEDADETQRAVEAEGRRCLQIAGDLRDSAFCDEAVEQAARELGKLDILVNNAAYQHHQESLEEITDEQLERTFTTNIIAYFRMARAALRHLDKGGSIINTGSITGLDGAKQLLDYAATKGAIHAFTKSLAQNLVERGIRVNCVAPGPIWTPLNAADKEPDEAARFGADVPMKRPGQPEEVAPAYVFFASEADSSYITGEVLTLLGGETTAG